MKTKMPSMTSYYTQMLRLTKYYTKLNTTEVKLFHFSNSLFLLIFLHN